MNLSGLIAVATGAAFGAWIRWWLGLRLNAILLELPLGTLSANLLGGYLIGVAIALFARNAAMPPEIRLFVITGFLGGLTTFSTFSAEVVNLLQRAQYGWAIIAIGSHLIGTLTMTALGILTIQFLGE